MKPTLLLVSSDPSTVFTVNAALSQNYSVLVAQNGAEGRQLFESHMVLIQMVILDMTLSDMRAQDWMKFISHYYLPYTLLVADGEMTDWMVASMKAGVMDIIRKNPLSEEELALAVRQGFDYSQVTHYIARVSAHTRNQTIQKRLEAFLKLLKSRKAQGRVVTPNEIALYFPSTEVAQELPLDQVIAAIESNDTYALIKQWKSRPKLLIVDDESDVRKGLNYGFCSDFEILLAESCEEAMVLISKQETVDVAILDIGLPGMSGDDFVPILKTKFLNIQIVMLTAFDEHRLITKTMTQGAGDYVFKPYNDLALKQRVYGLLQSSILSRVLALYMKAEG